jgi:hypothetical protein
MPIGVGCLSPLVRQDVDTLAKANDVSGSPESGERIVIDAVGDRIASQEDAVRVGEILDHEGRLPGIVLRATPGPPACGQASPGARLEDGTGGGTPKVRPPTGNFIGRPMKLRR